MSNNRREFLKKAGLTLAATPLAAYAVFQGRNLVADEIPGLKKLVVPRDPSKMKPEYCTARDPHALHFSSPEAQAAYLAAVFADHQWWMESESYEGAWKGPTKVTDIKASGLSTLFSSNCCTVCVAPDAHIEHNERTDWLYVHQMSGSGRELNWYWRPATNHEIMQMNGEQCLEACCIPVVMGVDQLYGREYSMILRARIQGPRLLDSYVHLDDFSALDELMQRHQVQMCVMDPYPERYLAEKFADRFPGRVKLAKHLRSDTPGPGLVINTEYPQSVHLTLKDYDRDAFHELEQCRLESQQKVAAKYTELYCQIARDVLSGNYTAMSRRSAGPYTFSRPVVDAYAKKLMDHQERMIMKGASCGFSEIMMGTRSGRFYG